jgi:hypothetical protein
LSLLPPPVPSARAVPCVLDRPLISAPPIQWSLLPEK